MTFVFGSWTLGASLLFSAVKNMSLLELIRGEGGPGQPESIVDAVLNSTPLGTSGSGGSPSGLINVPKSKAAKLSKAFAAINKMSGKFPYSWGGGHGGFCVPGGPNRGYDCSGCWSCVLGILGAISAPMTSGEMAAHFPAGPGKYITLYANNTHVFGKFLGRWFGTGSDKEAVRGGPAWGNHDTTSGYKECHPPGW